MTDTLLVKLPEETPVATEAAPVASTAAPPPPADSASAPAEKRPYPPPAETPTQAGPMGIRFDYNDGCRVLLPDGGKWKIRLSDTDTGNILFQTALGGGRINSSKRYFLRCRIEIWSDDKEIFTHDFNCEGKEVLVQFPVGTIGDTMGWFPYAVKFQAEHGCKLTCAMAEWLIPLYAPVYPDITFVGHDGIKADQYYATYSMGLFFDDDEHVHQPCDFRLVGLHRTAGYILGVDPTEVAPKLAISDDPRPIPERYVCIAAQSSTQCKYWNNPSGWREVVTFLKEAGYRVICIDQRT